MESPLYFEDFPVGFSFTSASQQVSHEESINFASMYDPQPQHVDALGAQNSLFGKLIVSGWHTAAMAMRLKLDGMFARIATGFVGLGMEQVRWPHPLFPGDDIYIRVTVLQARVSKSRTGHGVIEYRVEVFNQHDVLVMHMLITALVPCRPV